jgi:hypothetical protein
VPSALIVLIVGLGVLGVYLSTQSGQRLTGRLGIELPWGKGPARADRVYLLEVCDGDAHAVDQRLDRERERFPELSEIEIYRRAIRTHMNANPPDLEL